jgi:3-oxoacyl-[acyl-carrier-protein] synthase II
VVTGIGVVTSIGSTRASFWQALTSGVLGVAPIQAFDASSYDTRIASEVPGFDPLICLSPKAAKRMGALHRWRWWRRPRR